MKKKRKVVSQITIILLFLVGVLTMLYPFYVDALNNVIDQYRVERYLKEEQDNFEEERQRLIEENKKMSENGLAPGADPFASPSGGSVSDDYYKEHLIGTINIPDLAIELPLFDVTNDDLLEYGATVLDGTSYPVGGENTHSVISAHRGLPNRELFTNLPDLEEGDVFLLNVLGKTLAYEVFDIKVVTPDQTSVLEIEPGEDLVTLMTCTPYMINSHRLLVKGYRVPYTPEQEQLKKEGDQLRKLKQFLILLGTILLIIGTIYWLYQAIANYRLRQIRFDFSFYLESGDKNVKIQLYDKKGKKPLRRDGENYVVTPDINRLVTFTDLPGGRYRLKVDNEWLLQFGMKKKKDEPKVYKVNKETATVTNQENNSNVKLIK